MSLLEINQVYRVVDGNRSYVNPSRCQMCGEGQVATVALRGGPATCRDCYVGAVGAFDHFAKAFHLPRHGVPALPAPPVQEVWITRPGETVRIGLARLALEVHIEQLELHAPILFPEALGTARVDVVVDTWKGAWTALDVGHAHHVRKAEPLELLASRRYAIVMPDDVVDGVVTVNCRRMDI